MHSSNFWRYAGWRMLNFVLVYVILVYAFSALLDAQLVSQVRQTLYWEVSQAAQGLQASGELTPEEHAAEFQRLYGAAVHAYGFDRPFLARVHVRAARILRFDFAETASGVAILYRQNAPVLSVIGEYATPTAVLFTTAFVAQLLLGILLGTRNASRHGSILDRTTSVLATATMSVPPAVAALFAVLLFVYAVPIAPSNPWVFRLPSSHEGLLVWARGFFSHFTLPFLTVVFLAVWGTAHMVRNVNLGTLHEDFISAARARGLPEKRVLLRHGLRASAPPIATMAVTGLFASLWGSFLVEPIFQWRGIGTLFLHAIRSNDMNMLLGLLAVVTGATQAGLLLLDLTYGRLDPRIKVGQSQLRMLSGSRRAQRAAREEIRRVHERNRPAPS